MIHRVRTNLLRKLICLSTAHLRPSTRRFLSTKIHTDWPVVGGPFGDCGWILHVDEDAHANFGHRRFKELWQIFEYAADLGYSLILFDDVEDPIAALPVFLR